MPENPVRDSYLRGEWSPYPVAPASALSVDAWLEAPRDWACGRLRATVDGWRLESGGRALEFRPRPEAAGAPASALVDGDVVAARLARGAGGGWDALEILLLAPCLAEPARLQGERNEERRFDLDQARRWQAFVAAIRARFAERGFVEARTPSLVASPGTEPYLDSFAVEWRNGRDARRLHLPTSPEFHLKRLLARGWPRVFELKECFRNGEAGIHHQPEFLMLEWYRAYETLDEILADADGLFAACARAVGVAAPPAARTVTVRELLRERAGLDLRPDSDEEALRDACRRLGIGWSDDDSWDDLFFRIFLERVEGGLGLDGPTVVRDYPPRLAALARIKPDGWADRAEIYWRGLEIANGFHELNDPEENARRFGHDRDVRLRVGREPFPVDDELMAAFRLGMPPAGGIALGVDRLFMALTEIGSIEGSRPFPFRT